MQTGSKGGKEYADRVIKIKSPNNEAYTKAVEDMAEQKKKKEVRSMVGIVIFTLLVCITTATCVLGCKYLDKQGDLSYAKFKELNQKLDNLEKMLSDKGHGGRG